MLISQRAAQRIVGDPEILAAFDEIQTAYVKSWAETTPAETEKRELAYQHFKAVTDVQAVLRRRAQSAQVRDLKVAADV